MKLKLLSLFAFILSASLFSCSDDEETKVKGDPDITHAGAEWNIASIDYTLIDQSTSGSGVGQTYKSGTKENAGTFYFVDGSTNGSFELNVEGYNKEDFFSYSNDNGSISIVNIEQSVGVTTNQNVLVISGDATATEMMLEGSIVKQSTTGQFTLTASISLVKK